MTLEYLNPEGVYKPPTYSQACRAGKRIYVAGQTSQDEHGVVVGVGDAETQIRQVFENLRRVIEGTGGSLNQIAKMNIYVTDMALRETLTRVRTDYLSPPYPPSTLVGVTALARPEFLVEIEVVVEME